jgi:hypothetical protein
VVRGEKWPLNIVFRGGSSENNTVVVERGTVERATLAPV